MRFARHALIVLAFFSTTCGAWAQDPQEAGSAKSDSFIREEFSVSDSGKINTSLGTARGIFLEVDATRAGEQIRHTAKQLREATAGVADDSRTYLQTAAHDLDKLAKRVEEKSVKSVQELDQGFARTFHALALHNIRAGYGSWQGREHRLAGHRLRAAADNLEVAIKSSGQRMTSSAEEAIKESRLLSGKLIEGAGYAVDDVGLVFEGLGKQVENLGERMEPTTKYPERMAVPKR